MKRFFLAQEAGMQYAAHIPRREPGNLTPLSFMQQQMWLLAQLLPHIPVYNETIMIHLPGPLNVPLLEQSLNEIIQRHTLWRTNFPLVNDQPVQVIHPAWKVEMPLVDIHHLLEEEREEKVLERVTALARSPFNLTHLPLLRALLIRLDEEDHRLYLVMHHIIFDTHALYQVFLPELHALYTAFINGQSSSLSPLLFEYADFAAWQQEQLRNNVLLDQQAYWNRQLANAPVILELPTDRSLPTTPGYHGSRVPFMLSEDLTNDLKLLSQREEIPLDTLLMTALLTLLHRYSGQNDIMMGSTGCKNWEAQRPIGVFFSTLLIRADLAGTPTFQELAKRVHSIVLEAQAHQDVPFDYLVKALEAERTDRQSIIQVMFSLEPASPTLSYGWTITRPSIALNIAIYDLFFALHDQPNGLTGWLEYNADLFDDATIKRILQHWEVLLRGIVHDHTQHLSELPILTLEERQQIVVEWNDTRQPYPDDRCIHQIFEVQAKRTPEATALVFARQQMTYRELDAQSNQLAHHLRRAGVGPEILVGICMERSLQMIIATLGVLKAGGAYVPLDPQYPKDRQSFLLQDTQPLIVLTHKQYFTTSSEYPTRVINLDSEWETIAQESSASVSNIAEATNLAYIIYTSGSTGEPKGVQITHGNLVNATFARITYHEPIKRLLFLTPFIFDASVGSIFGTLCQGGTLVLPEVGAELEITSLADLIAQYQITHFVWSTVLYALLLENATARQLASLRAVTIGGEACPRTLVERHYALLPHVPLFNDYGPTEGTIWSSVYRCQPHNPRTIVPIGRPIANVQIYLLDAYLQPAPIGVAGELYIGGAGVARGYHRRPDLTAERFIPSPFNPEAGSRLYKTGDVARYLPTGDIEFLRRADQQMKIRGLRIEPDEIKEVLLKHIPEVREAVITIREITPGDQRLVGYLVPAPAARLVLSSVRQKLLAHLPSYMIPGAFVVLDKLPLSATGKIDYAALSTLETAQRETEETYVAPTHIVHYQLLNIWEELLETRPIGIKDNFFMLGGHSLLAARLVAHIEQVFGKKIALSTLFAGPTIEQLADALQKQEDTHSHLPIITVQTGESKRPFFFLHGNWKGEAFYCFRLARAMGSDQPFYALGTPDFSEETTLPTVERIAAFYIEQLRTIQPEGPYLLGGYCNGGMLAYEMARQLRAQGQEIDLLALIIPSTAEVDTFKGLSPLINTLGSLLHIEKNARANFFLRVRHMLRHIYRCLFPSDSRLRDFPKLIAIDTRLKRMFPPVEALRKDYISMLSWVVPDYKPGYYPGKILFFWSREELFLKDAWHKASQAEEVEEFVLPGTGLTVIGEYIGDLADRLGQSFREAQKEEYDDQDTLPRIPITAKAQKKEEYDDQDTLPRIPTNEVRMQAVKDSPGQYTTIRGVLQWVRANSTLLFNSGSLICTLVVTSALGFVYWWLAARQFSLEAVGLASAAISAMSLLATFCLLGLGTLLITEIPRRKGEEASLVSTALIVVAVTGGCAGAFFAIIAPFLSHDFRPLQANLLDILLFATGVSLTAITLILDQVFIALLQGGVVLLRNAIWSLTKLIAVYGAALWLSRESGLAIYATWAIGNLVSFLPFVVLVIWKRERFGRSYLPRWRLLRKLGPTALLHHILNLIVQAPTLALPVIVTALLSARVNAWFYIASLIMTFLFAISISFTVVLHATNPSEPLVLRQKTRLTMSVATIASIAVGGVFLLGGNLILSFFGPDYAEHALWILHILTLGAFPLIIKNHYLAISRVKNLIAQAIGPIAIGALLELGIAAVGARIGGLSGLSIGWVVAMYIEALFMFPLVYQVMTYKTITDLHPMQNGGK